MRSAPIILPNDKLWFPDPESATEDGLLAVGGDLNADRLLIAYGMEYFHGLSNKI